MIQIPPVHVSDMVATGMTWQLAGRRNSSPEAPPGRQGSTAVATTTMAKQRAVQRRNTLTLLWKILCAISRDR